MRKLQLPLLAILLFSSCQKQIKIDQVQKQTVLEEFSTSLLNNIKVRICHKNGVEIVIDEAALMTHIAHGDAVDLDGDGYFNKENSCTTIDCNDNNAVVNPGAIEVCGNGIDDNCNGQVDEECIIEEVTICTQTWMLKNLNVSTYRNGDPIPQVADPTAWTELTTGAWCYYENNNSNGSVYGKLYNWYAVNDPRGLAPTGWHIPTDAEWTALSNCLGGESVAGGKMKSTGTLEASTGLWYDPNMSADNSSGFTGLPGGSRSWDLGGFDGIGYTGFFWSSSGVNTEGAWYRNLNYNIGNLERGGGFNQFGFYVRCIKD
jgi:uncharacterized protein (TIGR02145 family)